MKILTAQQIQALDAYTMAHEPISSIDLMERASLAFVSWFLAKFPAKQPVTVFAGLGNNGGDGLAIARLLRQQGYEVAIFLVGEKSRLVPNALANLARLQEAVPEILQAEDMPAIAPNTLVIDAIFGAGLNRPIEGMAGKVIAHINQSGAKIIAVDIASGLYCDAPSQSKAVIKANYTVTFETPKLSLLLPQNEPFVGEWHVLPIGSHHEGLKQAQTPYQYIDLAMAKGLLRERSRFSHKGTFGHALLVAGMRGKMGAALLSAKAVLRAGAGLLTVHVPECGLLPMQTALPEAMCSIDKNAESFSEAPSLGKYQAIGVGPGLGQGAEAAAGLERLMEKLAMEKAFCPAIFDADALNLIAAHTALLSSLPPYSVLTPHPKEFERLAGTTNNHYERLERLIEYSHELQLYVVLKGAHTAICTPEGEVYFNSTGNSGMATAGSGDVLTGIITALLAQGYRQKNACILGVYLHGLAGDLAAQAIGQEAMMATDIIEHLGKAYQYLRGN